MASKRCPHCDLVNPGSATKCDCGMSFVDGSLGNPLQPHVPDASSNGHGIGAKLLIAIVTVATALIVKWMIRNA